ncbi:MAG: pilus assembly protein PilM [Candidatus Omnitrophica bacterium]|nr:pilus assembly protein PilM [Candidatus Omnitrophota bacterium]
MSKFSLGFLSKFSHKPASIIVVDLSSGLKLLRISTRENKILDLKAFDLPKEKTEAFVLQSLQSFLKNASETDKEAVFIPPGNTFIIKRLQLPALSKQELAQSIKWQIKDEAAFDNSKAVLDFQIVKKFTKEDGSELLDIILAAGDSDKLTAWVNIIKQAGLSCVAVIPAACAYAVMAAKYPAQNKSSAIAVLDLQEESSFIATYKDGHLDFYRELPLSIAKFRQLLADTLVTDSGKVQLSAEQINKVLFEDGVPVEGIAYKDKVLAGQIISLLRPGLERLSQEIKRSLLYYDSQYKGGQVEKIYICGKAAGIVNLDKFLSAELALPVAASSAEKISTVGLNILPIEFRSEKIESFQKLSLRWLAGIAFLLLLVSFIFASGTTALYQKRLDNSLVHLQVISQVRSLKSRLDSFNNFLSGLRDVDVEAGKVLKRFSNIAPADLYFDELHIDCDNKTGMISGHIDNIVNPDAVLAKLVNGMTATAYFKDINIASMEQAEIGGKKVSKFQVEFKLQ